MNIKFHQFPLIHEIQCPQNSGDIHTDKPTDRQAGIFLKWSNRVEDISKHVNPPKTGCQKFSPNPVLSSYIL